jgi:hypothetical protein
MAGSTMRFQKYRFTKAKGLRFMMNGTQKQLKTPAIRKKRVMIRAKFAGSGKNFIGKHFNDLSYNTFLLFLKICKSKMFHVMQSPKIDYSVFLCVRGKAGYQSMITTKSICQVLIS